MFQTINQEYLGLPLNILIQSCDKMSAAIVLAKGLEIFSLLNPKDKLFSCWCAYHYTITYLSK